MRNRTQEREERKNRQTCKKGKKEELGQRQEI